MKVAMKKLLILIVYINKNLYVIQGEAKNREDCYVYVFEILPPFGRLDDKKRKIRFE